MNTLKIIIAITVLALICWLFHVFVSYKKIVAKLLKTQEDVLKRQKLIRYLKYTMPFIFSMLPYVLMFDTFYYEANAAIMYNHKYGQFIAISFLYSFLFTIVVVYSNNLISRLISPIYVYDDVKDANRFCLYLRSFGIDNKRQEKLLCGTANSLFPTYAIGDPNSYLQPNGAQRVYLPDEIWKEAVGTLMDKSSLIILRVGQTDGTIWEIEQIIRGKHTGKTLYVAYSEEDFLFFYNNYLLSMDVQIPIQLKDPTFPMAFVFVENDNCIKIHHTSLNSAQDVKYILDMCLYYMPDLDEKYKHELRLRHANILSIYSKELIPKEVDKVDWRFCSPLINIRDWHWSAKMFFWVAVLLSGYLTWSKSDINGMIPIYLFCIFSFFYGNRLSWLRGGWSSTKLFLRNQKEEAILLWQTYFIGLLYSLLFLVTVILG